MMHQILTENEDIATIEGDRMWLDTLAESSSILGWWIAMGVGEDDLLGAILKCNKVRQVGFELVKVPRLTHVHMWSLGMAFSKAAEQSWPDQFVVAPALVRHSSYH